MELECFHLVSSLSAKYYEEIENGYTVLCLF